MGYANQTTIAHISYPWRMIVQPDGTLAVNADEQDSLNEILSAVAEITVCPMGAWVDRPSFGIPSQLFAQAPLDAGTVTQAIQRSEPRAVTVAQEYPDQFDAATRHLTIDVSSTQPDQ